MNIIIIFFYNYYSIYMHNVYSFVVKDAWNGQYYYV